MNRVEEMLEVAQSLQDKRETEAALEQYSKTFDVLVDEAAVYAREKEGNPTDMNTLLALKPQLLAHSNEFLKRDITAAYILNAMGILFGDMKEYENAQQKLTEAIAFIPDGMDFNDPADNLERLAGEIAAAMPQEEDELADR